MVIDVIQEDIDKAIEQRNKYGAKEMLYSPYRHCPIACALTRVGLSFNRVGGTMIFWNNVDFACLPYPVVLWIERFDGKWEGDPFSFDIRERRS